MLKLGTVSVSLSSEEVSEDSDHDVVDVVGGVLDDGVDEEEDNSDILEAVGGEEGCHSVEFNNISNLDGGSVGFTLVEHLLSLFKEGKDFSEVIEVVVLNKKGWYVLELFKFGIDLWLDEVEGLGSALVFPGSSVELVKGADGQKADKEGGENDGFHR